MKLSKFALTPPVAAMSVALCAAVSALRADAQCYQHRLDYVQCSSGTGYFILDYTPNPQTVCIEALVRFTNVKDNQALYCARGKDSSTQTYTMFFIKDTKQLRFDYNSSVAQYVDLPIEADKNVLIETEGRKCTLTTASGSASYDYTGSEYDDPAFTAAGGQLQLYASYTGSAGKSTGTAGRYRLYYLKVYELNPETGIKTLKYDLIPVVGDDGKAGLCDTLTDTMVARSGTFTGPARNSFTTSIPSKSTAVTAIIDEAHGFSPGLGTTVDHGDGEQINCSVPSSVVPVTDYAGLKVVGWKLYETEVTGDEKLVGADEGTSFDYTVRDGVSARIEWQFEMTQDARTASPAAYAKRISFTVADTYMAEGVTLTNFPLLVRLSTSVSGFSYGDFVLPRGGDMVFTDADGNPLEHEVDEWNEGGTSYVWVKLPRMSRGTTFTMHYGNGASPVVDPTDVWREYHAVWHFNEEVGPAFDASGNGRVAMPIGDARKDLVRTSGKVGYGRGKPQNSNFSVGMADFRHGGTLSISGWFLFGGFNQLDIAGRTDFGMGTPYNSTKIVAKVNGTSFTGTPGGHTGQYLTYLGYGVHDDKIEVFGMGGKSAGNAGIKDTGTIAKGSMAEGTGNLTLPGVKVNNGNIDEVRIRKVATADAWVKADSDSMNATTFVTAGASEAEPTGAVVSAPIVEKTEGGWQVSVSLLAGSAKVSVVYACEGSAITNALSSGVEAAPQAYTDEPVGLAAGKVYRVTAIAEDADGVVSASPGTGLCTGEVSISRVTDADDESAGLFRVTLGDGETPADEAVLVKYTVGGAAVSGEDYLPLSGEVWIHPGETSAVIPVVTAGLIARSATLTVTLAEGAYTIGSDSSASLTVTSNRDPADLVWTAGAGIHAFGTAANWDPQFSPTAQDTVTLAPSAGIDTTAKLSAPVEVSATTFSPEAGAVARLDLDGKSYFNSFGIASSGSGEVDIENGVLSSATFSLNSSAVRLSDLVLTNRTLDGGITFSSAGQAVEINEVKYWVTRNNQRINAFTLSGDDITFAASNLVVKPNINSGHGENININVTGKRNTLDLSGTNTYVKGGFDFGSASAGNTVTLREGVAAGGWTGGGSTSFSMDGAGNVLQFLDSKAKSTLRYPRINGEGNVLRTGEGGNLSVGDATTFNGTGNRIESYGTLAFTGAFNFGTGAASSGNRLLVSGSDAVVSFSDAFKVGNDTEGNDPVTLEFVAGTNFWAEAPIRQTSTSATLTIMLSNTVFAVDAAPALDAIKKNRCKLPLMSFKSANATNVDWTAFNDTLVMPRLQHGTLRLETALSSKGAFSSATLWCDVKRDIGLMILVR